MKYIYKLTKEQKKAMSPYAQKWIKIGLRTGKTDWDTFDKYFPICYEKAGLKYPKNIVRVSSPLVGALASSIARAILQKASSEASSAVGSEVRSVVYSAIKAVKKSGLSISWHYWLGGQFWVGGSWCWGVAFTNFFFDICRLKLSEDIMERALAYRKVCESVNYIWPNRDFVMVCARPTWIDRDDRGRLHSETRQAIRYPDGWGLYMYHGMRVNKKIIETPDKLTKEDWLNEKNLEVRRVIQERMGERFVEEIGGKTVGKHRDPRIGEVIEIDISPDTERVAHFLKAQDWSTERMYYLRIPPKITDPMEAQAWSYSDEGITLTKDDFDRIYLKVKRT